MKKKTFVAFCVLMVTAMTTLAQTQVIAHRGYWKTDGSAQNSIRALVKADTINC